jgi:KUP system potassium uptake protein
LPKAAGSLQRDDALELAPFLEAVLVAPPIRVEGTAVFLTANEGVVPSALLHNLKHNRALHRHNLFLTVNNLEVPRVPLSEQVQAEPMGNDCWAVRAYFGFMDDPDVPRALAQSTQLLPILDNMATSYFLSRDIVVPTLGRTMAVWRQKLFSQMHHSASGAADFLKLPNNAVVEMGSKIEM